MIKINIVLVEPEIPQNTGNIARTCAAVGAKLHLVEPLGFSIDDKYLKRAGLDYWNDVLVKTYKSFDELVKENNGKQFFYATTKALNNYTEVKYPEDAFLVFGKESAGLPEELLKNNKEFCVRIPMRENMRSLNLANSVAIILFEGLRQNNFCNLNTEGRLTKFDW